MKTNLLIQLILFFTIQQIAVAQVNVLVIGSPTDSSTCAPNATSVSAFDPARVVTEFKLILEGAGLGEVNVTLEDSFGNVDTYRHTNLFS